jgi:hypothetical protein
MYEVPKTSLIMAPAFIEKWRLHSEAGAFANGPNGIKSNRDLDPVPFESEERKWTWPSLLGFWIAEAFSISMYQVASSSITKGLSPGLAILAVVVGHILVCIPAMLNGYVGCIYGKLVDFLVFHHLRKLVGGRLSKGWNQSLITNPPTKVVGSILLTMLRNQLSRSDEIHFWYLGSLFCRVCKRSRSLHL